MTDRTDGLADRDVSIVTFRGHTPEIHPSVFLADGARIIGEVAIAENSSVWYNVVIRGDVGPISIGPGTNIQDLVMCHMTNGGPPLILGENVTVGHHAILHGATIGDGALIGMGAILLDGAEVGNGSIVAAGSVVTEGMVVPERTLVAGVPARIVRRLSDEQSDHGRLGAEHYRAYVRQYREGEEESTTSTDNQGRVKG